MNCDPFTCYPHLEAGCVSPALTRDAPLTANVPDLMRGKVGGSPSSRTHARTQMLLSVACSRLLGWLLMQVFSHRFHFALFNTALSLSPHTHTDSVHARLQPGFRRNQPQMILTGGNDSLRCTNIHREEGSATFSANESETLTVPRCQMRLLRGFQQSEQSKSLAPRSPEVLRPSFFSHH